MADDAGVTDGGGGNAIYWVAGIVGGIAVAASAWYFLVYKKSPSALSKASIPAGSTKPKGIEVDIKAPDTVADVSITTDASANEGNVTAVDSATKSAINAAKVANASTPVTTNAVASNGFHIGQTIIADGAQSIQRMKANKTSGGQPSNKDDGGKLWGYSKVADGDIIGTVSVIYDAGILVKAPVGYLFPYYYVTFDQILGK